MALEESTEYAATQHGIAAFAIKQYTVIKRVERDPDTDEIISSVEVSRSKPMTRAVNPGDDISMYPEDFKEMCKGFWTMDVIAEYEASIPQEIA